MTQLSPLSETRLKQILAKFGQNADLQPRPYRPDPDAPWTIQPGSSETQTVTALMNRQSVRRTGQEGQSLKTSQALVIKTGITETSFEGGYLRLEGQIWRITNHIRLGRSVSDAVFQLGLELVADYADA